MKNKNAATPRTARSASSLPPKKHVLAFSVNFDRDATRTYDNEKDSSQTISSASNKLGRTPL